MRVIHRVGKAINRALTPLGIEIRKREENEKPWDHEFGKWIAKARAAGKDPNDLGDASWWNDPLKEALERHYLPHVKPTSVILELGPGSGRLTRHLIGRCQEMVLVDYSRMVCDWLRDYLDGKGAHRIYRIARPSLPMIETESIDLVVANGVFEHLDLEEMSWFLQEFHRVLKPGGVVAFNFEIITTDEGLDFFWQHRPEPGKRCIFRFHHPETVERLALASGYATAKTSVSTARGSLAYAELTKATLSDKTRSDAPGAEPLAVAPESRM